MATGLLASTIKPQPGQPLLDCEGKPVSRHNDIFACLVAEHGHFKTLLQAFDAEYSSAKNPERLRQICAHLIHDVSSHTAFEEAHIQDKMESMLGNAAFTKCDQEDTRDKNALAQLESRLGNIGNSVEEVATLMRKIKADLLEHMTAEENEWWPAMHAKMNHAQLVSLHDNYLTMKRMAMLPTHPHPLAGNAPMAQKIAGPVVGLADHAYDAVTGFGGPTSGSAVRK